VLEGVGQYPNCLLCIGARSLLPQNRLIGAAPTNGFYIR
jgi:hypothetical protein